MAYFEHLWLYFVLLVGIVIVPGMDMMFVLANALVGGRRSGLAATAGIMAGGATHTVIGLAAVAILAKLLPPVFSAMLVIGSLYMLWIGWQLSRSSIEVETVDATARKPVGRVFAQGLITALVNPKAWMFVMSVFPQFMKPDYGPLLPQALAMGVMTISVQGAIYGGLALAALKGRDALVSNRSTTVSIGRGTGWLLMAVAALTLWQAVRRL
jgi:threonine/homoserine/homoserine lactone efflux protein